MAEQQAAKESAKAKPATRLRVLRTEWLGPHMVRVVAGGEGLANFRPTGFTDSYVKVVFPAEGVEYPEPFDMRTIRAEFPVEQQPRTRTYTVRHFDAAAGELVIDFVHHGDRGLAGPWAARLEPGDEFTVLGPGGAYAPDPEASWHLLVGDDSAMPAIGAALEAMPAGALVHTFIEVEDEHGQQPLPSKADVRLRWLHRSAGGDIVRGVRDLEFPAGDVQAFVHGEAGFVRELRKHLLNDRGVPKARLSLSGYWRRGKDDEHWRAEKAAEKAAEQGT